MPPRRRHLLAAALAGTALPRPAPAQTGRVVRIGWLTAQREASLTPYLATLRAGLAEAGYAEGRNLQMLYRYGDDDTSRVPALAQELLRQQVPVIIAQGTAVNILAGLHLPVPVVYVVSGDPVAAGLAESLSRPRGNMTGMTFISAELNGKRLELLRDIVPGLQRVAVIANPEHPGQDDERAYTLETGRRMGLEIAHYATRSPAELEAAFESLAARPPQAMTVFADGFAIQNRERLARFAIAQRLPLVSGWAVFAESGALCTYGPRLQESYRRLAYYVDRILRGARPADLPIERPTVFELVVNLRTAAAIGLAVPPTLLAQADALIE